MDDSLRSPGRQSTFGVLLTFSCGRFALRRARTSGACTRDSRSATPSWSSLCAPPPRPAPSVCVRLSPFLNRQPLHHLCFVCSRSAHGGSRKRTGHGHAPHRHTHTHTFSSRQGRVTVVASWDRSSHLQSVCASHFLFFCLIGSSRPALHLPLFCPQESFTSSHGCFAHQDTSSGNHDLLR